MGPYRNHIASHSTSKHIEKYVGEKVCGRIDDFIQPILNVLWNNRYWNRRKIKIRIDHYDSWSMDHTLALIIVPMLKQLKATKHGAPFVDDEDVPKELRSIYALPREPWDTDGNHFKRWEWVLDEMIFAFEHKLNDDWQDEFRSGEVDWKHVPCQWDENGKATMFKMEEGPNHTYKCDYDAIAEVQKRIDNEIGRAHV